MIAFRADNPFVSSGTADCRLTAEWMMPESVPGGGKGEITPTPLFRVEGDDDTRGCIIKSKVMIIVMCTSATQDIKFYGKCTGFG
jgi:hypothetical protein